MAETEMKPEGNAAGAGAAQVSLLDDILAETKLKPSDDAYNVARRGVTAFITELLAPGREIERVDKSLVDAMIAELDARMSAQVNEIIHQAGFQKLESAWRGLRFMIERVDFRENIRVQLLNVSKEELLQDFENEPDLPNSGLYNIVYKREYGVYGGKPYGTICANYEFGPGPEDMTLLRKCAAVAATAHAPFITNASPEFFGAEKSFLKVPNLKDLKALFEGPQYARWHSFRESEDARYVGLCMPRFLLRLPYGENQVKVKSFNFEEQVVDSHQKYLWGHASTAFASRVADSFAKYRWCPNI